MPYHVAATILLGILGLLNFALTLGLIHRLRAMTAEQAGYPRLGETMLRSGQRPEPFAVTTLDSEQVDQNTVAGNLVGFFTPNCPPCQDQAPRFAEYARTAGLDRGNVLAVIQGDRDDTAEMAGILRDTARVVVERNTGPAHQAFRVTAWPSLYLLDEDGTVRAADGSIDGFPSVSRAQ